MALYQLNLVPPRIRQERAQRLMQVSIFAGVLVVLSIPVGIWYMKWSTVTGLKERVAQVEREQQPFAGVIEQVNKLKRDETELARKLGILDQLVGRQGTWIRLLETIGFSQAQVQDLWLTDLTSMEAKSGPNKGKIEVTIRGMAFSLAAVYEFARILRESELGLQVEDTQMTATAAEGERVVGFTTKVIFSV